MENQKNPIITGLISVLPAGINTMLSLIRDKKQKQIIGNPAVGTVPLIEGTEFVHEEISKGVSLSSKRILNIAGTGLIISLAVNDLAKNGITKMNLILFAIGVAYSTGMALITYLSERK